MSGRPKGGYKNAAGKRIPGVTTIIGKFKEAGGLMYWAWDQGMQGLDYRDVSGAAADSGTLAHSMIEKHLVDLDPDVVLEGQDPDVAAKAKSAFGSYMTWESQSRLEIVEQETALVSEKHQFGGTLDAIGYVNGELCLLDWKTSNAIYSDYLVQLAAYKLLWEELNPGDLITGGFHLMRFAKEYGDFTHKHMPELQIGERQFLLFRQAYENDKELKKRAK